MNHFSQQQLNKIFSLIREVEKLTDVEKLFLYLHLPCGKSDLIEGGKLRPNGRLRALGSNQVQSAQSAQATTSSASASASASTSASSASLSPKISQSVTLSDFQKQIEQMPKRPDQETTQTYTWILSHLEVDPNVSLPKQEVYEEYKNFCQMNQFEPLCVADFGKAMKYAFPCIKPRRLGQRGNSRYCYSGLRKRYKLDAPILPLLGSNLGDSRNKNYNQQHESLSVTMDTSTSINNQQLSGTDNDKQAGIEGGKGRAQQVPSERLVQSAQSIKQPDSHTSTTTIRGYTTTSIINQQTTNQYEHHILNNNHINTFNGDHHHGNHHNQASQQQHRNSIITSNGYHQGPGSDEDIFNATNNNNINTNSSHTHQNTGQDENVGNNSDNNTTSMTNPLQMSSDEFSQNNRNSSVQLGNQAASRIDSNNTSPTLIPVEDSRIHLQPAVAPASSFEQYSNLHQSTSNYHLNDSLRPGTPDDDDYCHNYLYINSHNNPNNNHHANYHTNNTNGHCMSNQCSGFPSSHHNNIVNINYANHYRHPQTDNLSHHSPHHPSPHVINNQQHSQQQQPQQQQHLTPEDANPINTDDNQNSHVLHQDHYQNHNQYDRHRIHHQAHDSNNSTAYQVDNESNIYHRANNPHENNTDGTIGCVEQSYSENNDLNRKPEPPEESMSPFKRQRADVQQEMTGPAIDNLEQHNSHNQTPFNMFTLDTCVSSPFQSPASTPYPSCHMILPAASFEQPAHQLDNFNRDQDSIILSGGTSQNHYMTT